jgi:putative tryptophan/tyrosine transport system substrate-binding protein
MDRRTFICRATSSVLALPYAAFAQPTTKVYRVGYLRRTSREPADIEALRLGLRELGYVEGQNLAIEERYANGDACGPQ